MFPDNIAYSFGSDLHKTIAIARIITDNILLVLIVFNLSEA